MGRGAATSGAEQRAAESVAANGSSASTSARRRLVRQHGGGRAHVSAVTLHSSSERRAAPTATVSELGARRGRTSEPQGCGAVYSLDTDGSGVDRADGPCTRPAHSVDGARRASGAFEAACRSADAGGATGDPPTGKGVRPQRRDLQSPTGPAVSSRWGKAVARSEAERHVTRRGGGILDRRYQRASWCRIGAAPTALTPGKERTTWSQ